MSETRASTRQVEYVDPGVTDAFSRDPITPLTELARVSPVAKGRAGGGVVDFGAVTLPNIYLLPDDSDVYLALGYDAVHAIVSDNTHFLTGAAYQMSLGFTFGKVLFTLDPPEHPHYRKLVSRAFTPKNVNEVWMDKYVRAVIDRRMDSLAPLGRGDLVFDFAMPYPFEVIAAITGVPADKGDYLAQLVVDGLSMLSNPEGGLRALDAQNELFLEVVAEHRKTPGDDMTSALIDAEVDGERLTDDEISLFLRNLIAAGLDTTYRGSGSLYWNLLTHPDQLDALYADRSLIPAAVAESLRMSPPGGLSPRVAVKDVTIGGVDIPAGAGVLVCWLAANHDETRWVDPQQFDIGREPHQFITFGAGAHACLGMNLAQAEMRHALQRVLERLPGLRPDPDEWDGAELRGFWLRSPTKLPVLWNAA